MTVLLVEVAALLGLALLGWLAVGPSRDTTWRVLLSLPAGIAAAAMALVVLLVVPVPVAYPWAGLGLALVVAAVARRRDAGGGVVAAPGARRPVAAALGVLGLVVVVTAVVPLVNLTADSFRFVDASDALATEGGLADVSLHLLATRNLVVPALHGLAVPEFAYLRAVGPLLGLVTLGVLARAVRHATGGLGGSLPWLLGGAAAAVLATTNRFVFSTFYVNSHVLIACWVLVMVVLVRGLLVDPERPSGTADAWVVGLFGAGLALARAEGGMLAALVLLPLLVDGAVPVRVRRVPPLVVGATMVAWQGGVLLPRVLAGATAEASSVIGLLVVGAGLLLVVPLLDVVARRVPRPLVLAHGLVWLAVVVLGLRELVVVKDSVFATWRNVTGEGLWGGSLLLLAALVVVAVGTRRVRGEQAVVFPLATFVPFGLLLALLRGHAYRVGAGDSLNRMLLHVVPLAILLVAVAAVGDARPWLARRAGRQEPTAVG